MDTTSITEQVRLLREENRPIREIAKILNVTKYTVEKAVKELVSDALLTEAQAVPEEAQTPRPELEQIDQTTDQTLNNVWQTVGQTAATGAGNSLNVATPVAAATQMAPKSSFNTINDTEKARSKGFLPGIYPYLVRYRDFLKNMQRVTRFQRHVWVSVHQKHLAQLQELRAEAQELCVKYGEDCASLLVSEVVLFLEHYLKAASVLSVPMGYLVVEQVRYLPDKHLAALLASAQKAEFFSLRPRYKQAPGDDLPVPISPTAGTDQAANDWWSSQQ